MVTFNTIPNSERVPFVAVEFDSSRAQQGSGAIPYRVLIVGQKLNTGTAAADSVVRVTSAGQAQALFGRGSMLHRMMLAYFANNRFTEVWAGVLADDAGGAVATGTITATGTATGSGTHSLYIGGVRVPVAVAIGQSATAQATAIAAAINAALDLPVTASAASSTVTLSFRHKGEVGNGHDLRVNYQDGEQSPAGTAITVTAMAGGTTNPTLTNLIATLGDSWFHVLAVPYTDATSLTAVETELADRESGLRMIDGIAFTAKSGTVSALATLGQSRNSREISIVSTQKSPTPAMEVAAAVAGVVAYNAPIDPARPFQTLPLAGVLPPADADRNTFSERNTLLYDGISTLKVDGGRMLLERLITTSQTSASGAADTSYLDVTTRLTLMYLRYSFRSIMGSRYPRHKLAKDGTRYGAGQFVLTPSGGRAEAIAIFRQWEELGLVEGFEQFKADLVVEINAQDPNRLDFLLPADLINQLIVIAAQIQFRQ